MGLGELSAFGVLNRVGGAVRLRVLSGAGGTVPQKVLTRAGYGVGHKKDPEWG